MLIKHIWTEYDIDFRMDRFCWRLNLTRTNIFREAMIFIIRRNNIYKLIRWEPTFSGKQWAAVRIQSLAMRDPPHQRMEKINNIKRDPPRQRMNKIDNIRTRDLANQIWASKKSSSSGSSDSVKMAACNERPPLPRFTSDLMF